jgi:hypothetical protein
MDGGHIFTNPTDAALAEVNAGARLDYAINVKALLLRGRGRFNLLGNGAEAAVHHCRYRFTF